MDDSDFEKFRVNPEDFVKTPNRRPIKGGCGKVFFVTNKITKQPCVRKEALVTMKHKQKGFIFSREVKILALINHPAIIKFIGFDDSESKGNIYLTEAENGSLDSYIELCKSNKNKALDDTQKLIIAYGIARGMEYLHYLGVVHRDLKAPNILLDSELYPYLADFGTSRLINSDLSSDRTVKTTTAEIMAPEYIRSPDEFKRTKPIDVFSYAMVLYYLLTEQKAFPKDNYNKEEGSLTIMRKIVEGYRPQFPDKKPTNDWINLIEQCWNEDPSKRPTFEQICRDLEPPKFNAGDINRDIFMSYKEKIDKESAIKEETATKNIKTPIELLKEEADEGDPDASNSYGLLLYNGYGIGKDRKLARDYFELAANNGNYESMLWLSLILKREDPNSELSSKYLDQSIESNQVVEAQTINAQRLIAEGDIEKGKQLLLSSIQHGSINAMISYGDLCEAHPEYGNSTIFYNMASNCCHCLRGIGSYLPIDYKVYYCNECDVLVCEGCAKSCHKDHDLENPEIKDSFECECAELPDKCTAEFVGEMKFDEQPVLYQHLYQCKDCNHRSAGKYICKACAENCHKGHNVVDCGIKKGYCSCGTQQLDNEGQCSLLEYRRYKDECSCAKNKSASSIRFFQCVTCGLCEEEDDGICEYCAHKCHCGHVVLDRGVKKASCNCKRSGICKSDT